MDGIVGFFDALQRYVGAIAGFGVSESYSVASFCLLVGLSIFGALCINHIGKRHDNVHLLLNVLVMFAGGVIGNGLLRGLQLPLGNELVLVAPRGRGFAVAKRRARRQGRRSIVGRRYRRGCFWPIRPSRRNCANGGASRSSLPMAGLIVGRWGGSCSISRPSCMRAK